MGGKGWEIRLILRAPVIQTSESPKNSGSRISALLLLRDKLLKCPRERGCGSSSDQLCGGSRRRSNADKMILVKCFSGVSWQSLLPLLPEGEALTN